MSSAGAPRARSRRSARSGGLLLRTRVPGTRFADYEVTVEVDERRCVLDPFPEPGSRGVFDRGEVRIETRRRGARRACRSAAASSSGARACGATCAGTRSTPTYFAGYAMWNYLNTPHLLTRDDVEVARGRAVESGRRGLAPSRGRLPRRLRHPFARADVLLRRAAAAAPPRLRRGGGRRLGARRPLLRRPRRGRRAEVPDPALGAPDRPAEPLAAVPDDGLDRARRHPGDVAHIGAATPASSVMATMADEARPLAHPGLALQREGALGARLQGRRARAPRAAAAAAHGGRAVAHARRRVRRFRCSSSTGEAYRRLDRDHRCARAALPRAAALSRGSSRAAPRARDRGLLRRGGRAAHARCSPGTRRSRTPRTSASSQPRPCRRRFGSGPARSIAGPFAAWLLKTRYGVGDPERRRAGSRARRGGLRPHRGRARRRRVPRRRHLHRRRPHRGVDLLPARAPSRGPALPDRLPAAAREVSGSRSPIAPPSHGSGRCSRATASAPRFPSRPERPAAIVPGVEAGRSLAAMSEPRRRAGLRSTPVAG